MGRRRRHHSRGEAARTPPAPAAVPSCAAPPPLVQVLGGNVVTTAAVLACLNTADATPLRRLHPAIAIAIAGVPWADTDTVAHDLIRWRAALPAAVGARPSELATSDPPTLLAALRGVTALNLANNTFVTDSTIVCLPTTLRMLNVSRCTSLTRHVRFKHLTALESLDCSRTDAVKAGLRRLPPSLRYLRMHRCKLRDTADFSRLTALQVVVRSGMQTGLSCATFASLPPSVEEVDIGFPDSDGPVLPTWPAGGSLAHLTRLRILRAAYSSIDNDALAALPPTLTDLDLGDCRELAPDASFAHLTRLRTLNVRYTYLGDAALLTLPPFLVSLDLFGTRLRKILTPAAVFPDLPALRMLNVSRSHIGDVTIASMPAGLEELHMTDCAQVTHGTTLSHLVSLRALHSSGTDLSRATIAACRARGCVAPADGMLSRQSEVTSLVALRDGRLVSATYNCNVALLWDPALCRDAVPEPVAEISILPSRVNALAVLPDGLRVAAGMRWQDKGAGGIAVWDPRDDYPYNKQYRHITKATIPTDSGVQALAVLRNGRLVAGCTYGTLCEVDADAGAIVTTAHGHRSGVTALAVLPDGSLAAAFGNRNIELWNTSTWACGAELVGHTAAVVSLAVLPDGRLASGSDDAAVRLWDVGTRACMRVLAGHTKAVRALAVLPAGRLATASRDGTTRVWDIASLDDMGNTPVEVVTSDAAASALLPLPGGRLATGGDGVRLWQLAARPA